MSTLTFRSRVDPLLAALIFVPMALGFAMLIARAFSNNKSLGIVAPIVFGFAIGLVVWIYADTSYRITDTDLLVRSGPLRVSVPLAQIRRVTRTRSVLSAPALSMNRLEITYAKAGVVVISPKDDAGFLAALKERAPGAELPGSRPA